MGKIGRNHRCPCGSGVKFKYCHGRNPNSPITKDLKTSIEDKLKLRSNQNKANESQRILMQGKGRPIISTMKNGVRCITVGKRQLQSKKWITFSDFLMDYMYEIFGSKWGNAEIAKQSELRHPIIKWYQSMCLHQSNYIKKQRTATEMPVNGATRGYMRLAYDLYLIEHNIDFPSKLISRLKNKDQFEGALYEAYVTGCFAKAGFEIRFENEDDSRTTHSEFIATHRLTGDKYAVEAKTVSMRSSRAGKSDKPVAIKQKLRDALRKKADFPRIIFIELSRFDEGMEITETSWMKEMANDIISAEKTMMISENPAPSAYVFITNRPFVHDIESLNSGDYHAAFGFKIDDFPVNHKSVLEMHKQREKHKGPYALLRAFQDHWNIPQTFDERLPAEAFGKIKENRLLIGNSYLVPDESGIEVPGELLSAVVMEDKKSVQGVFRLHEKGTKIVCRVPLSDMEMEIYHQSPETFFGVVEKKKTLEHPLDLFDFFFNTYSKSTRKNLLKWMNSAGDIQRLKTLSQRELAEEFCAKIATEAWMNSQK